MKHCIIGKYVFFITPTTFHFRKVCDWRDFKINAGYTFSLFGMYYGIMAWYCGWKVRFTLWWDEHIYRLKRSDD